MARVQFTRPTFGTLRTPLSAGLDKELTGNPMAEAATEMKPVQISAPTKLKLGAGGLRGQRIPRGNPFKRSPFYGD